MTDVIKKYVLDLLACYTKPEVVAYLAKQKFGDKAPTVENVRKLRIRYRNEIRKIREELFDTIPLLDIKVRWKYLQSIMESAETTKIKLEALKIANQMTKQEAEDDDEIFIKQVVMEVYKELKQLDPEKPPEEILKEISDSIGIKALDYIEDIIHIEKNVDG